MPNGRVWGITSNDEIFTRASIHTNWVQIQGKLAYLDVMPDGRVWGINATDHVFTLSGPES